MIPPSMSASSAASSRRSTVHHQAAKGVRSKRETIETPPEIHPTVVPAEGGTGARARFRILHFLQQVDHGAAFSERLAATRVPLVLRIDPAFQRRQPGTYAHGVGRRVRALIAMEILHFHHEDPAADMLRL